MPQPAATRQTSTGKTRLSTAIAFTACQKGPRPCFLAITGLVMQLVEWREQKKLEHVQHQLGRLDLLALNELGYVPCSKVAEALLFEVVSRAYERASLIVTTNLPFESWADIMGSERPTGEFARSAHPPHPGSREKWRELAAPREQDNLKPGVSAETAASSTSLLQTEATRALFFWASFGAGRGPE